jgi:hypothetical protein
MHLHVTRATLLVIPSSSPLLMLYAADTPPEELLKWYVTLGIHEEGNVLHLHTTGRSVLGAIPIFASSYVL